MAAADMTDEEWVGRWGLQRGGTVGVDDHLTMVLYDDNTLRPPLPEQVLEYNEPTPGYCCPLTANTYGIEFERFHIRDMSDPDNPSGGAILFEVRPREERASTAAAAAFAPLFCCMQHRH